MFDTLYSLIQKRIVLQTEHDRYVTEQIENRIARPNASMKWLTKINEMKHINRCIFEAKLSLFRRFFVGFLSQCKWVYYALFW